MSFLDRLSAEAESDRELLSFDAEAYQGIRYVRPRTYAEAARRVLRAEYVQVRVERGWVFACRNPYRAGLDLPVVYLERLFDLDLSVHGHPHRASVRMEGGADVDQRMLKALESALEEERSGRRRPPAAAGPEWQDLEW